MSTSNIPDANAAMAQSRLGSTAPSAEDPVEQGRPDIDFVIGPRVASAALFSAYERQPEDPLFRPLRIYALDPAASALDGALSIVNVPYEHIEAGPRGPRGAILEIVSTAGAGPEPPQHLNLDSQHLLIQQGRPQTPEDGLFQQQMVYAVCMTSYAAFRQALGRDIAWGFRGETEEGTRLRIRPSVDDLENAFYDRTRGEISFGTFAAGGTVAGRNIPGGRISLCLSHDVVVHEMSHALLDGLRSHFLFPSNLDVLAFHEAFADLIAVFQRFTYRDVVLAAIRQSRGKIRSADLLTSIGVQFAQATFCTGALRSAVGGTSRRYEDTVEPHNRGELLVVAVFEAFTTIFNRRVAPLLRLATNGTGQLAPGALPDELALQLTERASRLASQFLMICIRAIDYCPPVDITFGEFLRAVITADMDVVPHDEHGYREAWIDAFAKHHIYPSDVPSLSESALCWKGPEQHIPPEQQLGFAKLQFNGDPGRPASAEEIVRQATALGQLATGKYRSEFGLVAPGDPALGADDVSQPVVQSIRTSRRVGPSGQVVFDLVAEITQRRIVKPSDGKSGFEFFGGATAILDPKGKVRLIIRKSVTDGKRLRRQRAFVHGDGAQFFGLGPGDTMLPQPKLLLQVHETTRPSSQVASTTRALIRGLASCSTEDAQRYFLRPGASDPLVSLLKACLNRCTTPAPNLDNSPTFDSDTERAINRLQTTARLTVDGIAGPATWAAIGAALQYNTGSLTIEAATPPWIHRLIANSPLTTKLSDVNLSGALDLYEFGYGPLSLEKRAGLTLLIKALSEDSEVSDIRWAAYMLATVKHECAETWQPIEELGRGAGHTYGTKVTVIDDQNVSHENTYYGRGYVQLTWKENYQKMGRALNLGDQLMFFPERVLDPDTAYKIMSYGMRNGSFTGARLATYINDQATNYESARRIINGGDQAARIAGYARYLQTILLASVDAK
jgi:hypothetical protein